MPQMGFNNRAADALLIDNNRSYFTNVGYVRTANFQIDYSDVDSHPVAPEFGKLMTFELPKKADLLGQCDLVIEFNQPTFSPATALEPGQFLGWVEALGFAMINKIKFKVGEQTLQELTGDQMMIAALLQKTTNRPRYEHILRTGKPLVTTEFMPNDIDHESVNALYDENLDKDSYDRIIAFNVGYGTKVKVAKKMFIPLDFFFSASPDKYFPMQSVAQCNPIKVEVTLNPLNECLMAHSFYKTSGGCLDPAAIPAPAPVLAHYRQLWSRGAIKSAALRCMYVHVTGPEAEALKNKESVRLLKVFDENQNHITQEAILNIHPRTANSTPQLVTIDLAQNMRHPVSHFIVAIRRKSDLPNSGNNTNTDYAPGGNGGTSFFTGLSSATTNKFAFHGDGRADPNVESAVYSVKENLKAYLATAMQENGVVAVAGHQFQTDDFVKFAVKRHNQTMTPEIRTLFTTSTSNGVESQTPRYFKVLSTNVDEVRLCDLDGSLLSFTAISTMDLIIEQVSKIPGNPTVRINDVKLILNGSSRHFDGNGIPADWMRSSWQNRLFAGSANVYGGVVESAAVHDAELNTLKQLHDGAALLVLPFSIDPEGDNPSGHTNMSSVSSGQLKLNVTGLYDQPEWGSLSNTTETETFQFDVYGIYYNWTTIKDGRASLAFS